MEDECQTDGGKRQTKRQGEGETRSNDNNQGRQGDTVARVTRGDTATATKARPRLLLLRLAEFERPNRVRSTGFSRAFAANVRCLRINKAWTPNNSIFGEVVRSAPQQLLDSSPPQAWSLGRFRRGFGIGRLGRDAGGCTAIEGATTPEGTAATTATTMASTRR